MLETKKISVFISPLNWGMGHASRIIPVIDHFHKLGYEIFLGGSGTSGTLLQSTFPNLPFFELPSFEISYSKKDYLFGFSVIRKLPALLRTSIAEHRFLNQLISKLKIDVVISDNRYGLFNKRAHCVLITHQISPVLPVLFRWAELPLFLAIKCITRQFTECWVPDFYDPKWNLTGRLSHRFPSFSNTKFIGILSRFTEVLDHPDDAKQIFDIVIVLSGPPPHSEILADIVLQQSLKSSQKILIITGFLDLQLSEKHAHVTLSKHLEIKKFRDVLLHAKIVVCRAGYSAIMDMIALKRTAYIIPTPGQSEQQYLAKHLEHVPLFRCVHQKSFDLNKLTIIPDGNCVEWLYQLNNQQKTVPGLDQMIKAKSIIRKPVRNPR